MIGVPAAHTPMNGTLLWFANGTIAIETGVSRPPNSAATFSRCTSSRAATTPLAGIAFVVAHQQFDLLAEHAALGVDLVDRDGKPAHDRLAGLGRLAGHGGDQAELQGVLGGGGSCEAVTSGGKQQAAGDTRKDGAGEPAYFTSLVGWHWRDCSQAVCQPKTPRSIGESTVFLIAVAHKLGSGAAP